jgi:hypothetical protein
MGYRTALALAIVIALFGSAACGIGSHSGSAVATSVTGNGFLYVSDSLANSISAFQITTPRAT